MWKKPKSSRKLLILALLALALATLACQTLIPGAAPGKENLPPAPTRPATAPNAPADKPTDKPAQPLPPTQDAASKPPANPAHGGTDSLPDVIKKALEAQIKVGKFRVTMEVDSAGKKSRIITEVILPDRFHMVNPGGIETIIITDKAYMKTGETWQLMPGGNINFTGLIDSYKNLPLDFTDVKLIGEEKIKDTPTRVYGYTSTLKMGNTTFNSETKLWVRISDGLPIQQEVTNEANGVKAHNLMTIDYDPNLKIEAPIP
jgi:hypothetical protein